MPEQYIFHGGCSIYGIADEVYLLLRNNKRTELEKFFPFTMRFLYQNSFINHVSLLLPLNPQFHAGTLYVRPHRRIALHQLQSYFIQCGKVVEKPPGNAPGHMFQ